MPVRSTWRAVSWRTATRSTCSTISRAAGATSERAGAHTRLPGGPPEGFIEAFANLYRNVARTLRSDGTPFQDDFPTVQDGARGVHFILTSVESHRAGGWVDAAYEPPA